MNENLNKFFDFKWIDTFNANVFFADEGDDGTTSPLNPPPANSDHDDDSDSEFSDKGMSFSLYI